MPEYTQEQIDALIKENVSKATQGLYTEEDLNKRVTSEVDRRVESGIQKGLDTQRVKWEQEYSERAKLTAEELAKKDFEEKLREIESKEKNIQAKANKLEAISMLSDANVPKTQYTKIIDMLISPDAESTKANVDNFINVFNETKSELETNIKSQYAQVPPPNQGTSGNTAVTKAEFNKMGYADKLKLKQENPELFNTLMK